MVQPIWIKLLVLDLAVRSLDKDIFRERLEQSCGSRLFEKLYDGTLFQLMMFLKSTIVRPTNQQYVIRLLS